MFPTVNARAKKLDLWGWSKNVVPQSFENLALCKNTSKYRYNMI